MASGSIHYKFKSAKAFDTLAFDGSFIAVGELKRLISEKKGLGKDHACELVLTNAQDGSEYDDESALVWKNTSVIVRRVPSMKQAAVGTAHGSEVVKKVVYVAPPDVSQIPSKSVSRRLQMNLNKITKGDGEGDEDGNGGDNPLANMAREQAQQWESEKIAANAAAANAGRSARGAGRRGDGPPGPGYICFKCNKGGHWIQDCPLAADTTVEIVRTKHAYGIPQTKLEATTGGILVAPTGESAQMVAAEDEFQKMFGFLAERGNEPLALGNGEQETLALGTGQGEGEGAAAETEADKSAPPVQDAPPLPPGFVPPVPMGPPPPDAKKRDAEPALTPPEAIPNAPDMNALDPMGIMSMDTSIEGLKKMAEQLQKQQDLFDAKSLEVMEMGAAVGAKSPMAPPLPAMPPPPTAVPRDVPTGPPVFEEDDEDTVVMLAGEDDEPEPEPEKKAPPPPPQRSGAPPPPARKGAPPPPPAVIPESIAKAHEEARARAMDEGGRTREDSPPPGPRFGGGSRPPPRRAVRPDRGRSRRGRADSRERAPAEKRTRDDSRDAGRKRGRDSPGDDENRAKRRNGNTNASMSRENSAEEFTAGSKGGGDDAPRRRRARGGRGRSRGSRGKKRGENGGGGVMSRIG